LSRPYLAVGCAVVPDVLLIGDTVRFPELRHEVPVDNLEVMFDE
jgi:hypothetical protein